MGVKTILTELRNRSDSPYKFIVQENEDGTISYGVTNTYSTAAVGTIPNGALPNELTALGSRTTAELAAAPTAADLALGSGVIFFDAADPSKRYVVNSTGTAFVAVAGGAGSVAGGAGIKFPTKRLKVGVGGDSISWGVDGRTYPRSDWSSSEGLWGTISTPNLDASGDFISLCCPDGKCLSGEAITLSWDGTANMTVAIAGDTAGLPVDVTGGGFFHLTSGTNGKGAMVVVRWITTRPAATSDTGTVSGVKAVNKYHFDQWFSCGLGRQGVALNVDLRNFGITSDYPSNFLSRIGQIEAENLDAFFLLIGANGDTQTAEIQSCIDRLSASVDLLVVVPVFPMGTLATTALAQARAKCARETAEYAKTKSNCVVFNAWDYLIDPSGTSGSGLVDTAKFNTDYINLNPYGAMVLGDQFYTKVISQFFANIAGIGASGNDAYHATNNPYGNFLSTVGAFVGTSGTLGATPTPTGQLATSWTDSNYSSVNPWASVTYSKVAREDGRKGEFQRVVCATAGTGGSGRQLTANIPGLSAGMTIRLRISIRLTSTTLLNRFVAQMRLDTTASGNVYALAIGLGRNQTAGGTITSQWMHFDSGPVVVPADYTSGAVYIQVGCAATGSLTLDIDDAVVERLPAGF